MVGNDPKSADHIVSQLVVSQALILQVLCEHLEALGLHELTSQLISLQ